MTMNEIRAVFVGLLIMIAMVSGPGCTEQKQPETPKAQKQECVGLGCEKKECIGLGCNDSAPKCVGMGCEKENPGPKKN